MLLRGLCLEIALRRLSANDGISCPSPMPRRILFVAFSSRTGGAEVYLLSLVQRLPAHIEPLVAVREDGPLVDRLREHGVAVRLIGAMRYLARGARWPQRAIVNAGAYVRAIGALARLVRDEGIDLVHTWVEPAVKYGPALRALTGVPLVCTFHDPLLPPFGRLHRAALAGALRRHQFVIVPSRANSDLLVRAGVPASQVITIPNAVASEAVEPVAARARVRRDLEIQPDQPVIGMVGRFDRAKGHEVLFRALAMIAARRPDVCCLVVGDARLEGERAWHDHVLALARQLEVARFIRFAGWHDDVAPFFAAMDVMAHPSVSHDSCPGAVLEAMAAGRAVVASAVGGIPELIVDGTTGRLVPPGNPDLLARALLALVEAPEQMAAMGAAGRARARARFRWSDYVSALSALYDRVAGCACPVEEFAVSGRSR